MASGTSPSSSPRSGAHVIGTGSSRNRDFVLGLGADRYVDYTQQDVAEAVSGVDVAFDTVGGKTTQSLLAVVRAEIAVVLPLSQVRQAHELSESGHTRGKIILTAGT